MILLVWSGIAAAGGLLLSLLWGMVFGFGGCGPALGCVGALAGLGGLAAAVAWAALEARDHDLSRPGSPAFPPLALFQRRLAEHSAARAVAPPPAPEPRKATEAGLNQVLRQQMNTLVEILGFMHEIHQNIEENIKTFEKSTTIGHDILQAANRMAAYSEKVTNESKAASSAAAEGIRSVGGEIKAMNELRSTVGSSARFIEELMQMSKHVRHFVTRITDITKRTNLLALNAGIEAARAGESGRGFAVVATEIRTLADASAKAAEEIQSLLEEIQKKTSEVIEILHDTGKVEENIKVVYSAGDIFMKIVSEIKKEAQMLGKITDLAHEQSEDNELLTKIMEKGISSTKVSLQKSRTVEENLEEIRRKILQFKVADQVEGGPLAKGE